MSDLDADLYGDLYATPAPDQPEQEDKAPAETSAQNAQPSVIKAEPTSTRISEISSSSNQPQSIPTFEEPLQQTDYRDQGGYQNINISTGVRPSQMKDEGKMFIGGLNWDTTDESLREYFEQFGKVDACTIMRDAGGRSRCFAFLTFEDPASVNEVVVKEHFLDGKIIDPKRAVPRQEHQRATKLFIGGLAGTVTSDSMREFFSQYGKVVESTVMLDRETGRSKGFGFISLEDTDVQPFLGFGKLEIDGKLIDVKLAQPRYQRDNLEEGAEYIAPRAGGGNNFGQQSFGAGAAVPGANTPFDPQALASLYTRMFQMAGGGMNPMMAGMMGMQGMPGMRPMGMPGMGMPGMGMGAMGAPAGMGRGGAGMNPNIPRGPRGGTPTGPGPQRASRGQHNYHPYSR
ncbi:heterogeneous nuclear ribonucleoprotein HRP1 [Mycena floridula]|nr:heterogeneous nuclear ribonucleoprotein HRP1 [Mycena floridula]KAJ7585306.1 heterogeneous nuclear ribonucleoprotein HRP1 [Mycena floridula]